MCGGTPKTNIVPFPAMLILFTVIMPSGNIQETGVQETLTGLTGLVKLDIARLVFRVVKLVKCILTSEVL